MNNIKKELKELNQNELIELISITSSSKILDFILKDIDSEIIIDMLIGNKYLSNDSMLLLVKYIINKYKEKTLQYRISNLSYILNSISKNIYFKDYDKLIELFFINDLELLYINDMKLDFSKPFNIPSSNEFYFLSHLLDGNLPFKLIECFLNSLKDIDNVINYRFYMNNRLLRCKNVTSEIIENIYNFMVDGGHLGYDDYLSILKNENTPKTIKDKIIDELREYGLNLDCDSSDNYERDVLLFKYLIEDLGLIEFNEILNKDFFFNYENKLCIIYIKRNISKNELNDLIDNYILDNETLSKRVLTLDCINIEILEKLLENNDNKLQKIMINQKIEELKEENTNIKNFFNL